MKDFGESFPTSIYLQQSASIQPRTSPSKFGGEYSILFTGVLSRDAPGESLCGQVLSKNDLVGALPGELGDLTSLEELSLASNQLSGPVPPDLARVLLRFFSF